MQIGTQITAPEGWANLPQEVVFHFLCSDATNGRVLLALFSTRDDLSGAKASIVVVNRQKFEEGAALDKIVPLEHQSLLPPWLEPRKGTDLSQIDRTRSAGAKITHQERVENRLLHIAAAVNDLKAIFCAEYPEVEISRRARSCQPPQNESRFRLWLITYVCFGRDIWTLLPPFHLIGHWNRFDHPDTKFGAHSLAFGHDYGNGCSKEMAKQCVKSYLSRAKLGIHMTDIYEEAMTHDFHCVIVKLASGMKVYSHPTGAAFPTYWQFRYRVLQSIGIEDVQKTLYGAARYRNRIATSRGRFSEGVSNLMERIEADGRYLAERPRGYVEGTTLPPMCAVESRDVLSGKKLGIGFAFGKEDGTVYLMMLFCMAVPKDFFCWLMGVPFEKGEWVNEGLPADFAVDRGPGAKKDLIADLEKRFPIRGMAPSWSGQSKATVESGHPKNTLIEGEPTFVQSNLTPVELAKREILRLIEFNNSSNMEDRFDPDSELAFVPPTPLGLWCYYDKLFRNDAQPMRIDEAVRTFLTPTEFSVREDGVYLGARRFFSEELRETGILAGGAPGKIDAGKVDGYVLEMCVRHVWVEIKGKLLLLDAKLRIRGEEKTLYMSLAELNQWSEQRSKVQSAFSVHERAASSEYKERFEADTGKQWNGGKRIPGKPKVNANSRQEAREAQPNSGSKEAA